MPLRDRLKKGARVADKTSSLNEQGSLFDAYEQLSSESYEFITRTIAMHNWLNEAYQVISENPALSSRQIYGAWLPLFSQVYWHNFAAFFQPSRIALFPLGEMVMTQLKSLYPGEIADAYYDTFKLYSELQARTMSFFTESVKHLIPVNRSKAIDALPDMIPWQIMKESLGKDQPPYFAILEQWMGLLGETQFHVPKKIILYFQKAISVYPQIVELTRRYEAMFRQTWDESLTKFIAEINQNAGKIPKFKDFFNTYIRVFTAEYNKLLRSPEFMEEQKRLMMMSSDLTISLRNAITSQLEMFPFLPFVLRNEIDALEKTVYNYKKRIESLELKMRQMEERSGACAAQVRS